MNSPDDAEDRGEAITAGRGQGGYSCADDGEFEVEPEPVVEMV